MTLYVQAVDRVGRTATKTYQFYVAPPSPTLARWKLNDSAGSASLFDDTASRRDATMYGGTLGVPGRILPGGDGQSRTAMQFNGTSDYAATSQPVLADTSRSFTVAAWVKLGDKNATRAVISQADTTGGFLVQYDKNTDKWRLTWPSAAATDGAKSVSTPQVGVWTHLAGVYDSAAPQLKLYVNGTPESTVSGSIPAATGPLRIGASADLFWSGSLAELQVWNRVLSTTEVAGLCDPLTVGKVAEWHFDEVGPGPASDAFGMYHDLTFYGEAVIPASGAGQTGTGLRLDGVDDYAAPDDGQVLNTDQPSRSRPGSVSYRQDNVAMSQFGSGRPSTARRCTA